MCKQKKKKRARCHNCKYGGEQFKINTLTHLHCEDPKQYTQEKFDNNEFGPWDSLKEFSDTCEDHKFNTNKINALEN